MDDIGGTNATSSLYPWQGDDRLITPDQAHDEHHRHLENLPMWVIFRPTIADYPGQWVTRLSLAVPNLVKTHLLMTAPDLDALRDMLPVGVFNIGRQSEDDPVIEEVWL